MSNKTLSTILLILGGFLLIVGIFEIMSHPVFDSSLILSILFDFLMGVICLIMGRNLLKEKEKILKIKSKRKKEKLNSKADIS